MKGKRIRGAIYSPDYHEPAGHYADTVHVVEPEQRPVVLGPDGKPLARPSQPQPFGFDLKRRPSP